MGKERFEAEDFRASLTERGDILIDDCPNGWTVCLLARDIAPFLKWLQPTVPLAILPCSKRADGLHDFRHEVCDCGASREDTLVEKLEVGI